MLEYGCFRLIVELCSKGSGLQPRGRKTRETRALTFGGNVGDSAGEQNNTTKTTNTKHMYIYIYRDIRKKHEFYQYGFTKKCELVGFERLVQTKCLDLQSYGSEKQGLIGLRK